MFQVAELSQEIAASQGMMDRISREKVTLMSELEQAKNQIMQHEHEVGKVRRSLYLLAGIERKAFLF